MASTGEVGCIGDDTSEAILKAMLSVGYRYPQDVLLSTGTPRQKADMLDAAHRLHNHGFTIYATEGTCRFLNENGIPAIRAYWPTQPESQPQVLQLLHDRKSTSSSTFPRTSRRPSYPTDTKCAVRPSTSTYPC